MNNRFKKIRFVLILILIFNIAISTIKIALGYFTNSSAILADGFHSLSDGFNNVVGIIAISFAYKPADESHPYGHYKIETILSLFVGFILIIIAFNILKENIFSFNEPRNLNLSNFAIIIMIITTFINIIITKYEKKQGKKLNSSFLISDAKHTLSDVYISVSIVISLIAIKFLNFPYYFDNIMAILVVVFIFKAAFEIIMDAVKVLSDSKFVDANKIKEIVLSFDSVNDVHLIKSRRGADIGYIQLHILVDPKMSVFEAHKLNHEIEDKIKSIINKKVQILIHIEPDDHTH